MASPGALTILSTFCTNCRYMTLYSFRIILKLCNTDTLYICAILIHYIVILIYCIAILIHCIAILIHCIVLCCANMFTKAQYILESYVVLYPFCHLKCSRSHSKEAFDSTVHMNWVSILMTAFTGH